MTAVSNRRIVAVTSEAIEEIGIYEKELTSILGREKFQQFQVESGYRNLSERLVIDFSSFAHPEKMGSLRAVLQEGNDINSFEDLFLKIRQIINLDIAPQGRGILSMMVETMESLCLGLLKINVHEYNCSSAVKRLDLEMLQHMKSMNRGWGSHLIKVAEIEMERNKDDSEKYPKAKAILEWIQKEIGY